MARLTEMMKGEALNIFNMLARRLPKAPEGSRRLPKAPEGSRRLPKAGYTSVSYGKRGCGTSDGDY
ncbi:MAG: hypothetical protein KTR19_08290 [Hyphomicrobiales bacterium]|nr:hypothetical protein [Hyphomicrobiales bacterium]